MFDSHPQMAVPFESYFIPSLASKRGRYERADGVDLDSLLTDLEARHTFRRWELTKSQIHESFASAEPHDFPDAIRAVYSAYATAHGKKRYGDKTPDYVRSIPLLAELFPEARFIHIIRDGRNVTLSYMEAEWGPETVAGGALFWRRRVSMGRRAGLSLGSTRYAEVRYEELVDQPETVLRNLCRFVEIDYAPEMLSYHERASELVAAAKRPHRHDRLAQPPTSRGRDWRDSMAPGDVATFETLAGPLLTELGYELGVDRPSSSARARAILKAASALGGHALHRAAKGIRSVRRR